MAVMSYAERRLMGARGRSKVEQKYDENIVVQKYLKAIEGILRR